MNKEVCQRYATAFFELSKEKATKKAKDDSLPSQGTSPDVFTEKFLQELQSFHQAFLDPNVEKFFSSPLVDDGKKAKILQQSLKNVSCSEDVKNFLLFLCQKGRLSALHGIFESYKEKWYESQKLSQATLTSSQKLSSEDVESIKGRLEQVLKTKVVIEEKEDPSLLGGLSVDVLGRKFNNSIFSQLSTLKDSIQNRRV